MIVTNNYSLPAPLYNAISNQQRPPEDGVFHVTEILQPPQVAALTRKHWDEITVDAMDLIKPFIGITMHREMQKMAGAALITERTMRMPVQGWTLQGTVDLLIPNKSNHFSVSDYKFASAWTLVFNPHGREEWFWQINIYAELARQEGLEVDAGEIIPVLYDWSEWDSQRNKDYPQNPVVQQQVEILPSKQVVKFINERIGLHKDAVERGVWPNCTLEEQWARPTQWAIKKKGGKQAIKFGVFEEEKDARQLLAEKGEGYEIEHRPGRKVRCERTSFCLGNNFCEQRRKESDGN